MKRKVIIGIFLLVIIGVIGVLYYWNYDKEENIIEEIQPEEEITDNDMRKTMVSLYYKNTR